MNFNDKFLNVCFKAGKILFSFLLLIALIVTIVMWCKTGITFGEESSAKVKYSYDVKNIVQNLYAEDLGVKTETISKQEHEEESVSKDRQKAFDIYNKFIDDNKLPESYKNNVYMPNDDEQKILFVNGLIAFYDNYKKEFASLVKKSRPNLTEEQIQTVLNNVKINLFNDAVAAYISAYEDESNTVANEIQQIQLERQANLIASLISLAVFILFLFLPILIRIEENTRK